MTICYVSNASFLLMLLAFIGMQLQGTLYNYYYVILRNKSVGGDATSKIFEDASPKAFPSESQKAVDILFTIFYVLYSVFDKTIHFLDREACHVKTLPHWFMTLVSIYGLGFQLLIIAVMLPLNLIDYVIPFFIVYSVFIFIFIGIRKVLF